MSVRTRFAPSPTGYLHVGGARTALFSWLYARKHGGTFVLRVEDTDRERSTQESINAILEGMTWLGLEYDEGPFYQTHRFERYQEVIEQLLEQGQAYHCYCTREELDEMREAQRARGEKPRYDGRCRHRTGTTPKDIPPVVRFKNPTEGAVVVDDLVKGRIVFNNNELDDLIIARSDGTPTYNLTVVVDDMDMAISHVIRGDDHVNNTPRQVNILQALGAKPPLYAHVPMILGADGSRLSKRHGAVSVMQYRDEGYMPEALINHLVRLGWSHGDQEIFSLDEMIELFDLPAVNNSAASFNPEKLLWFNQQYLINTPPEHVAHHLSHHFAKHEVDPSKGPDILKVIEAQRERNKTLTELADRSVFFYRDFESYDEKAEKKHLKQGVIEPLAAFIEKLQDLPGWEQEPIHTALVSTAEERELNLGKLAQPVRIAVSGGPVSPPIDVTLWLLGREITLDRLNRLLAYLQAKFA
jgi:glutamyl-tRNA synthetase